MGQGISVEEVPYYDKVVEAHGILGCVAWVIFFPLGAILLRVVPSSKAWLVHAAVMMFALALFTSNAGMGIWQASGAYYEYHAITGMVVFALAWLQPVLGLLHHFMYQKYNRRTVFSFIHRGIGRAIITLGMINGGLGLMYAGDSDRAENIAYGTVAAAVWIAYFVVAFWAEDKREVQLRDERTGGRSGTVGSSGKVYED